MSIKAVLFDLDGTLLPMDYDGFLNRYFGNLAKHMAGYGYDPEALVKNIWAGTKAMVLNDGSCMNETLRRNCKTSWGVTGGMSYGRK